MPEKFKYYGFLFVPMINESLITVVIVVALVYFTLKIFRDSEYYIRKIVRTKIYDFYNDPIYNRIIGLLNELDSIEYRKKEFRDAPNKLCNQNCSTRQKFLIKMYEETSEILSHIQTNLLIELNSKLKELREKYDKIYQKQKRKYNLKDSDVSWTSELIQYG